MNTISLFYCRIDVYDLYYIPPFRELFTVYCSPNLQEALELFRPDFISRSQGRLRKLEQKAKRWRALRATNPEVVHGHRQERCKQKRNCTTPDPLSGELHNFLINLKH